MKVTLPALTIGVLCAYMIPSVLIGMHMDKIAASIKSFNGEDKLKIAYASSLPNVSTMTVEQHIDYLKKQYVDCSAGTNYLSIISTQHQSLPFESSLEVAVMVEQMCSEKDNNLNLE